MNDLAIFENVTAVAVLTDEAKYSDFYKRIKEECDAFVPDLSTVTGRARIASQAHKVTRTKTAIDAAGKKLNEDARAKINAVDEQRRKIRAELDTLADEVRKPLTEWEADEEARRIKGEEVRRSIDTIAYPANDSAGIQAAIDHLSSIEIDPDVFRDQLSDVVMAKAKTLETLEREKAAALQHEADQAELDWLRQEDLARKQADAERMVKEDAERQAKEEAARIAKARADDEAKQKAREEKAAQTAREEATRKAQAEHAEQLAKIEAENQRLAKAEADRVAAAKKTADDEAARQKDRAHRGKIMGEAKAALIELGVVEDIAKKIVLAIVANEIPHVTLRF